MAENTQTEHSHSDFVTHSDCDRQVKSYKWFIGLVTGIISVLLALVIYSANQAYAANAKYEVVINNIAAVREQTNRDIASLESTVGKQTVLQQSITQQLADMKGELLSQRQEQKVLLERILYLQIEIARNSGITTPKQP